MWKIRHIHRVRHFWLTVMTMITDQWSRATYMYDYLIYGNHSDAYAVDKLSNTSSAYVGIHVCVCMCEESLSGFCGIFHFIWVILLRFVWILKCHSDVLVNYIFTIRVKKATTHIILRLILFDTKVVKQRIINKRNGSRKKKSYRILKTILKIVPNISFVKYESEKNIERIKWKCSKRFNLNAIKKHAHRAKARNRD